MTASELLFANVPTWAIVLWFTTGPFAAYFAVRRWCMYHWNNFGYMRVSDAFEAVVAALLSVIAGPLVLIAISLDMLDDSDIGEKKLFKKAKK